MSVDQWYGGGSIFQMEDVCFRLATPQKQTLSSLTIEVEGDPNGGIHAFVSASPDVSPRSFEWDCSVTSGGSCQVVIQNPPSQVFIGVWKRALLARFRVKASGMQNCVSFTEISMGNSLLHQCSHLGCHGCYLFRTRPGTSNVILRYTVGGPTDPNDALFVRVISVQTGVVVYEGSTKSGFKKIALKDQGNVFQLVVNANEADLLYTLSVSYPGQAWVPWVVALAVYYLLALFFAIFFSRPTFQAKPKSLAIAYLLWFLFGLAGAHRFYLNRRVSGAVWFLTCGIFGLGYLVDIVLVYHMHHDSRVKKVGGTFQYATLPFEEDEDIDSSSPSAAGLESLAMASLSSYAPSLLSRGSKRAPGVVVGVEGDGDDDDDDGVLDWRRTVREGSLSPSSVRVVAP